QPADADAGRHVVEDGGLLPPGVSLGRLVTAGAVQLAEEELPGPGLVGDPLEAGDDGCGGVEGGSAGGQQGGDRGGGEDALHLAAAEGRGGGQATAEGSLGRAGWPNNNRLSRRTGHVHEEVRIWAAVRGRGGRRPPPSRRSAASPAR